MKNWKVQTKLIVVLLAPLAVLVFLAGIGINERQAEESDAATAEELTRLAQANADLIHNLQIETVFSAGLLASGGEISEFEDYLTTQQANTDLSLAVLLADLESFESTLSDIEPDVEGESSRPFAEAIEEAQTRLDQLSINRSSILTTSLEVFPGLESLILTTDALLRVNAEIADALENPELSNAATNFVEYSLSKQETANTNAFVAGVLSRPEKQFADNIGDICTEDTDPCSEYNAFVEAIDESETHYDRWYSRATADQRGDHRDAIASEEVRDAADVLDEVSQAGLAKEPVPPEIQTAGGWINLAQEELFALQEIERTQVAEIVADANSLRSSAQDGLRFFLIVTLVAILVSVILALLVARAVARPLQRLTIAANRLSTEQLPALVEQLRNPASADAGIAAHVQSIEIGSRDEVGQLAEAFNTIQQVTIEVAEEQSALLRKGIGDIFINLARRNQTLLDRQIEFIDQLEANEEDPDQLDNLFKLDHLATRMRRNAESLLVLAGAEPPRRRGRPVALADVVRVAIGEVEDFARISLLSLDDAMVGGNVAVDLAHLLSELMENATHFSPPDTHVEVVGRVDSRGTYEITVSDQGIGMSPEQLTEANHQLAHPPLVGLALSRSLGFIVVGRLAQRFEIKVELQASPTGGIAAAIQLPNDIVTDADGSPLAGGDVEAVADEMSYAEEVIEEIIVEEFEGELAEGEEYELVEEYVDEYVDDVPEVSADASATDEFDRGLETMIAETEAEDAAEEFTAPPEPEPEPEPEPAAEPEAEPEPFADDRPPAEPPPPGIDITASGLVKRTPKKRENTSVGGGPLGAVQTSQRVTSGTTRSPEEVRKMLSRYRGGLKRGRTEDGEGPPSGDA